MFKLKFLQAIIFAQLLLFSSLFTISLAQASSLISFDPTDDESTPKEQSSCQTPFTEGKKFSVPTAPYKIVTTAFGKRYNESYWKALFDVSGQETVRFLKKYLKTDVYLATPASNNTIQDKCLIEQRPYFNSLTRTPERLQKSWKIAENFALEGGKLSSVLGMSFTDSTAQTPVILLHPYSGRSTLLHETFHVLFIHQRQLDHPHFHLRSIERESASLARKAYKNLGQYIKSLRLKDLEKTIVTFAKQIKLVMTFFKSTQLEEFVIEKSFLEQIKNGALRNIEDYHRQESIDFMLANLQRTKKDITDFEDVLSEICLKGIEADPGQEDSKASSVTQENIGKVCDATLEETQNFISEIKKEKVKVRLLTHPQVKKQESKPMSFDQFSEDLYRHPEAAILKRIRQDREALIELLHRLPETL